MFFFAILQDVELEIVLFERLLSAPSNKAKEFVTVAMFNFWTRREL